MYFDNNAKPLFCFESLSLVLPNATKKNVRGFNCIVTRMRTKLSTLIKRGVFLGRIRPILTSQATSL
jgi:hypothetical protein